MAVWQELRATLARLVQERPGAVIQHPDLDHTLRHGLWVRNRGDAELAIATNGQVTAVVVDPGSGEVVGGYAGFQILPLIVFRVPAGGSERIPLLIGTASFIPRLGYAVPPGRWGIQATLEFAGSGGERIRRRTPVLPLTVTG